MLSERMHSTKSVSNDLFRIIFVLYILYHTTRWKTSAHAWSIHLEKLFHLLVLSKGGRIFLSELYMLGVLWRWPRLFTRAQKSFSVTINLHQFRAYWAQFGWKEISCVRYIHQTAVSLKANNSLPLDGLSCLATEQVLQFPQMSFQKLDHFSSSWRIRISWFIWLCSFLVFWRLILNCHCASQSSREQAYFFDCLPMKKQFHPVYHVNPLWKSDKHQQKTKKFKFVCFGLRSETFCAGTLQMWLETEGLVFRSQKWFIWDNILGDISLALHFIFLGHCMDVARRKAGLAWQNKLIPELAALNQNVCRFNRSKSWPGRVQRWHATGFLQKANN